MSDYGRKHTDGSRSGGQPPFDVEAYLALGRANADKLPSGVAEALGPERDWADDVWDAACSKAAEADGINEENEGASVIRSMCRPNKAIDELVKALEGAMDILGRAESNASGNPEWINVGPRVAACREALAKAARS